MEISGPQTGLVHEQTSQFGLAHGLVQGLVMNHESTQTTVPSTY